MRVLLALAAMPLAAAELTVSGTHFLLDGKPFAFQGVSFFNAIYNEEFNRSSEVRRQWMQKFQRYGINVFRVWAQWDNKRGFVDTCPTCTLYQPDGSLRTDRIATIQEIARDADALGLVVELTLFSQESWRDDIRITGGSADAAVANVARVMMPHRNVILQIWNEFDDRTLDHVKTIRAIDPKRLVTNSPGVSGVLTGVRGEEQALDFLTPHTSRQGAGKPWIIAPAEIAYLVKRFRKPVVSDEPARNGTPQFGGPKEATSPFDHILEIFGTWQAGGYHLYHHDMFQMGRGHATVPPSGIPDPEFSPYHRAVFEFLAQRQRYQTHD